MNKLKYLIAAGTISLLLTNCENMEEPAGEQSSNDKIEQEIAYFKSLTEKSGDKDLKAISELALKQDQIKEYVAKASTDANNTSNTADAIAMSSVVVDQQFYVNEVVGYDDGVNYYYGVELYDIDGVDPGSNEYTFRTFASPAVDMLRHEYEIYYDHYTSPDLDGTIEGSDFCYDCTELKTTYNGCQDSDYEAYLGCWYLGDVYMYGYHEIKISGSSHDYYEVYSYYQADIY